MNTYNNEETHIEHIIEDIDKNNKYYISICGQNSHGKWHSEVTLRKVWLEK